MRESDLTFNLVWTGGVYRYLRWFVFSLLDQTESRFRFIANNCTPTAVAEMTAFADAVPERIVETVVLPVDRMVPHGTALDPILADRDDGDVFAFIDVDIKATRPFVGDLLPLLATHDAVTSGVEVWTDVNTLAEGELGVGGRHFYAPDGFVFGSPHFALYRRSVLREVLDRWGIGIHAGGKGDVPEATWARLVELGRDYMAYDTAKVLNILLQADGHPLVHREHEAMVHIGGLSHYLAPPQFDFATEHTSGEFDGEPPWVRFQGVELRAAVARYTAAVLREVADARPAPEIPAGVDEATRTKLELVRHEVITMVEAGRPWAARTGG